MSPKEIRARPPFPLVDCCFRQEGKTQSDVFDGLKKFSLMLQNQPNEWVVFAIPDTDRAQYWARATSEFSVNYDYSAFPFDRQGSFPLLSSHPARHS